MEYFSYLAALALVALGLAGTIVPAIPGLPLIFAGGWLIAWASGYELLGVGSVVVLALCAAVGVAIDFLAQILGAKKAGASRAGLLGAAIGTVLGVFSGVAGIIFLPLFGAVVGEMLAGRDLRRAGAVGIATWIGMAVGVGVKLALAFTMVALILFNSVTNSAIAHFWEGGRKVSATARRVPQAPVEAAPLEAYSGKPEPRRRYRRVTRSAPATSEANAATVVVPVPVAAPDPVAGAIREAALPTSSEKPRAAEPAASTGEVSDEASKKEMPPASSQATGG